MWSQKKKLFFPRFCISLLFLELKNIRLPKDSAQIAVGNPSSQTNKIVSVVTVPL